MIFEDSFCWIMDEEDDSGSSDTNTSTSVQFMPDETQLSDESAQNSEEDVSVKMDKLCLDDKQTTSGTSREPSKLSIMPDVVMQCIFESFDLRDRCIASQVCKRWHYLLTNRYPMEDVTVLNIFQNKIYKDKISCNKNIGLRCYHIDSADNLEVALNHCHIISSVKIWFAEAIFAGEVLRRLKQANIKMRCLDLYPYTTEKALNQAFMCFPELPGMTMRPHGQEYFWSGLDMYSFPRFTKMDTLMLDGFNIKPEVCLPESLTTLEWLNRSGQFLRIMPKLKCLVNLEYLMLGHAEFLDIEEFDSFLRVVSSENLPRLQYLIFRYCKIDAHRTNNGMVCYGEDSRKQTALDVSLQTLQMIKLDLCYADLGVVVRKILSCAGSMMRVISMNVISEETNIEVIYDLSSAIAERKLVLHFGILQKDTRMEKADELSLMRKPPASFAAVLGRFEASFMTSETILKIILLSHATPRLTDLKFIQSPAISNDILAHFAVCAPRLRKLSLINCNEEDLDDGVLRFVPTIVSRVSKSLQVIWKRKSLRISAFFDSLLKDHPFLIKDLEARILTKNFYANKGGEQIVIWDKKSKKTLYIQDFDSNDKGRILGIVMPPDEEMFSTANPLPCDV